MKRLFTIGLMLASAFALTNCSEELVDPGTLTDQVTQDGVNSPESSKGVPFTIYASAGSEADTKTQVVRDENGKTLKTEWVEGDKLRVVYEDKNGRFYGPIEFTVDPVNLQDGKFTTQNFPADVLEDVDGKYNWYFTYGFEKLSVDNSGNVTATVTIPRVQTQNVTSGKELEHLAINCPMLGKAPNLSSSIFPLVQMKHLATLHEVSISNETENVDVSGATPGDIHVYSFGVSAPTTGVWDRANRISLTGTYTIDLETGEFTQFGSPSDDISLTLPDAGVKIEKPNGDTFYDYKLYFVTAPIKELQTGATYVKYYKSATGDVLTETDYNKLSDKSGYTEITEEVATLYKNTTNANIVKTQQQYDALDENSKTSYIAFATPEIYRQDIFSFIVNGSARTVQSGETYKNFSSGVVKRFILPVKSMQYPLASDAVGNGLTWSDSITGETNQPVVSFENTSTIKTTINGALRDDVYQIGTTSASGTIILKGFAKELINALPAGFYASQLNNNPTAMALKYIKIWMPVYAEKKDPDSPFWNPTYIADHSKVTSRPELNSWKPRVSVKVFGVETNFEISMSTISGVIGMDFTDGITYSGLVDGLGINPNTVTFNGIVANGANDKLLIMDEGPVYKEMTEPLVQTFLDKFSTAQYKATLDGIKAIVNATNNSGTLSFPDNIPNAEQVANTTANAIISKLLEIFGNSEIEVMSGVSVSVGKCVTPGMFKDANDLMHKLRDMKFEIAIETVPYSSRYSLQPMLMWGFDKNAPL